MSGEGPTPRGSNRAVGCAITAVAAWFVITSFVVVLLLVGAAIVGWLLTAR